MLGRGAVLLGKSAIPRGRVQAVFRITIQFNFIVSIVDDNWEPISNRRYVLFVILPN